MTQIKETPSFDDVVGGYWGNRIEWSSFDLDKQEFKVHGWKPVSQRLKMGSVIKAEMVNSWAWFRVTKIEYCKDPPDMFFADLEPFHQEAKNDRGR